jgi:hypothetical protein
LTAEFTIRRRSSHEHVEQEKGAISLLAGGHAAICASMFHAGRWMCKLAFPSLKEQPSRIPGPPITVRSAALEKKRSHSVGQFWRVHDGSCMIDYFQPKLGADIRADGEDRDIPA